MEFPLSWSINLRGKSILRENPGEYFTISDHAYILGFFSYSVFQYFINFYPGSRLVPWA